MSWHGRNGVIRLVLALIRRLEGRTVMPKCHELAAELGITERTLFRYLAELESAGYPVPMRWREWDEQEAA